MKEFIVLHCVFAGKPLNMKFLIQENARIVRLSNFISSFPFPRSPPLFARMRSNNNR